MKKTFEISILNQKVAIRSDEDSRYVQKAADHLSRKIYDLTQKGQSIPSTRLLILAALNITDEYFKLQERHEKMKKEIEGRIETLVQKLGQALEAQQTKNLKDS